MWARLLSTAIGVWLMAAPAVLGYGAPAATNDRIVGPLAASVAIIAIWEATRPLRWVNLPLGAWLLVAPFLLGYGTTATVNGILAGASLVALALVRGTIEETFGGGWSALWNPTATNARPPRA